MPSISDLASLYSRPALNTTPASMLFALADQSDTPVFERIAAGVVQTSYDGAFAVERPEQLKRMALSLLPRAVKEALGEEISTRVAQEACDTPATDKEHMFFWVPMGILQQFALDFGPEVQSRTQRALQAALSPMLMSKVDHSPKHVMLTYLEDPSKRGSTLLSDKARKTIAEGYAQERRRRDALDPTLNGRPQEILKAPKPELEQSFGWWCLQLGFMLKSPHAERPDYQAVIRELGERCLRTMPQAHAQARAAQAEEPDEEIMDRYATVDNESLPRYARWLHKAGDYAGAIRVCEMALKHAIQPKSPGAFDRALQAAHKKLA